MQVFAAVSQQDFEARVLDLWMRTRVPLTRANLLYFTRAPRRKLDAWLDAMVGAGMLDIDSDDEGEMLWKVRGAARPVHGPERVEDVLRLDALAREVRGARPPSISLPAQRGVGSVVGQALARQGGEKSVLASGVLSFFLGPIGWCYAGPLREVIPAGLAWAAIWIFFKMLWHLPFIGWMLGSLGLFLLPISAIIGVLYAWQYNKKGEVTSLFSDGPPRLTGRH